MNLGYLREDGVIKPSFYNRYNFRVNVESEVFSWLTATANVMYSDYTSNGINTGNGANRGGVVLSVINTPTYAPVWNPDNPEQYYNNFYGVNITSPAENLGRGANSRNRENRLIASGNLLFKIIPGLTFNSKFTLDRRNGHNTDFVDPIAGSYGRENYGIGEDTRSTNQLLVWDNVANYVRQFGKHRLDVMVGQSMDRFEMDPELHPWHPLPQRHNPDPQRRQQNRLERHRHKRLRLGHPLVVRPRGLQLRRPLPADSQCPC